MNALPLTTPKQRFADYVVEQMAPFGPAQARRMFGGHGLYLDGLMFALIADEQLYFKSDETTRDQFRQRGLRPFTYTAKGREVSLAYYEAPPEVFDEAEAMAHWARQAFECALRARKPAGTEKKRKSAKA
ncbi:MAG: TfoX/Sxy family protein [Betaproteobacteria bacterium]